jgi:uncharacterized protein (TIGR03437 family)
MAGITKCNCAMSFTRTLDFTGLLYLLFTMPVPAQTFDTSGNATLEGDYFLRQVITTDLDPMTSAIGRAVSLTGVIAFDGQGNYIFTGQMMDTAAGPTAKPYSVPGVYSVASNALVQIQNPIDSTDTERGAVAGLGPLAIIASATEGNYRDLFVAIQAGPSASTSTINGSYQTAFIDFLQGNASAVRDGYATLTSTGSGGFASLTVNGAMANQSNTSVQQTLTAVTYSIAPNGSGTLTFPTSATPLAALLSGQKTLYLSSDGNLLLAGDPNGFDLLVGVKSNSSAASNSTFLGTYFSAGLENDASQVADDSNAIDSFYGSTLALGDQGAGVSHFRRAYFNQPPTDFTTNIAFNLASDGTYNDGKYQHMLAANGQVDLQVGTGSFYSLTLDIAAPSLGILVPANGGVIGPYKILNSANYAPITNPVAPGEFLTMLGASLSAGTHNASLPFSTTLSEITATVNGRPAPISFVSPNQVNILVPYATVEPYATLQLFNAGVPSNKVTLYANLSAPGVFTLTNNGGAFPPGLGPAAALHTDYTLVTAENPAKAGDTIQLYVTGLGAVTPAVADGAPAPSGPFAMVNDEVFIDLLDANSVDSQANVTFAGLAPGFAGLYQINFVVPGGVASGLARVNVRTGQAYNSQAQLYMQ